MYLRQHFFLFRASHLRMKCHYRINYHSQLYFRLNKETDRTYSLLICSRLNSISHAFLHICERRGTKQKHSIMNQLSATCLVPISPVFCPGLHKDDLSHIYLVSSPMLRWLLFCLDILSVPIDQKWFHPLIFWGTFAKFPAMIRF